MATSSMVRAGRAFVEIGGDESLLARALDRAAARIRSFSALVAGVGAGLAGLGTTALGGLFALAKAAADYGDTLGDISERTGLAIGDIGALRAAAEDAGSSFEGLEKSVSKFARLAVEAANGTKSATETLKQYGLTAQELQGLTPFELLGKVADVIADIEDPARRTAAAYDLLGKSGAEAIPILLGGSAGLLELRRRYTELGISVGDAAAASVGLFDPLVKDIGRQVTALRNVVGAAAAEIFIPIAQALQPIIAFTIQWANANRGLVGTVAILSAGAVGLGAALVGTGVALYFASAAVSAFGAVFSTVMGLIVAPIGILTGLASVITTVSTIAISAFAAVGGAIISIVTGVIGFASAALTAVAGLVAGTITIVPLLISAGAAILPIALGVAAVGAAAFLIYRNFDAILSTVQGIGVAIGSGLTSAAARLSTVFSAIGSAVGSAIQVFGAALSEIATIVSDSFGAMRSALRSGDFELAGRIAITGFRAAFLTGLIAVIDVVRSTMPTLVNVVFAGVESIANGFALAASSMSRAWTIATTTMRLGFTRFASNAIQSLSQLQSVNVAVLSSLAAAGVPGFAVIASAAGAVLTQIRIAETGLKGLERLASADLANAFKLEANADGAKDLIDTLTEYRDLLQARLQNTTGDAAKALNEELERTKKTLGELINTANSSLPKSITDGILAGIRGGVQRPNLGVIAEQSVAQIKATVAFGGDLATALRATPSGESQKQTRILEKIEENTREKERVGP